MRGLLVIDKPAGPTSHDVVNVVRRLFSTRRVGHTGTLDPMATGVLVVLIGPATRLSRFVVASDKRYLARLRLGETTTTYDAEGEIIDRSPVQVDLPSIRTALTRFEGEIEQVPPMYSAVKVRGKKLYELAREGKTVEREPRTVTLDQITLMEWDPPELLLDVTCSSGTYIRSLAHDLGQHLGCGAHLTALRRTRTGAFTIEQSHTLEELQHLKEQNQLARAVLPAHAALSTMPRARLSPQQEQAVRYGQQISLDVVRAEEFVQVRDQENHLVAVLRKTQDDRYQPKIVLPSAET